VGGEGGNAEFVAVNGFGGGEKDVSNLDVKV
jgi:hypothetical protein